MIPIDALKKNKPGKGMMVTLKHDIYAGADKGPFLCANCEYFTDPNKCSHPEIIKLRDGKVERAGCCDYFEKA